METEGPTSSVPTRERDAGDPQVDVSRYSSGFSLGHRLARALWAATWWCLFRFSPRPLHAWRRGLLRLFGARIRRGARVYPSARIWFPANLEMGEHSCLAFGVNCYNVAQVTLGGHVTVSQYVHLCAASHDIADPELALTTAPIEIGEQAWVCADAFVGPGVRVGRGAVVAARACVTRHVEDWTVVGGNPAREIGKRQLRPPAS